MVKRPRPIWRAFVDLGGSGAGRHLINRTTLVRLVHDNDTLPPSGKWAGSSMIARLTLRSMFLGGTTFNARCQMKDLASRPVRYMDTADFTCRTHRSFSVSPQPVLRQQEDQSCGSDFVLSAYHGAAPQTLARQFHRRRAIAINSRHRFAILKFSSLFQRTADRFR